MNPDYWHQRWINKKTGFDQTHPNTLLTKHWKELALPKDTHIFVPLCGKTIDVAWLLEQGHAVTGAELHTKAVKQLFDLLDLKPQTQTIGELTLFQTEQLRVWAGDVFNLKADQLGQVGGIYDRAALVALPKSMRAQYTKHLMHLTNTAPQLVISFDYDQSQMDGPPFVVNDEEMSKHYADFYTINKVGAMPFLGGLRGYCPAMEEARLLQKI